VSKIGVNELRESLTRPYPERPRHFERPRPSQLRQTELLTFVLKWHNQRVYLVAFLDNHRGRTLNPKP
jgi:hypothetical protein